MNYSELLSPINSFLKCSTPDSWVEEAIKPENLEMLLVDHLICELKASQTAMWLIRKYAVDKESGAELLAWLKPYEDYIYKREGALEDLGKLKGINKNLTISENGKLANLTKNTKAQKPTTKKSDDKPIEHIVIDKMVMLIREELHHFVQVLEIMEEKGIEYRSITPGRYAKGMMKHVISHEPETLIDKLICGAYIEARSCERFAKLAPHVDKRLGDFYISLLRSEARHFQDYLTLAEEIAGHDISERIEYFGQVEAELITSVDSEFKFHSGAPN